MKKILLIILSVAVCSSICLFLPIGTVAFAEEKDYRSVYMIDYDSGTVIIEENADSRYPIASMVKIMTLAIVFDEIQKNNLKFDDKICISDYAASMGGSQLFLDAGEEYSVSDLIKGVVVCSANDAATALGERISGSITEFVVKMNNYAKELGMNDTLFCNATGLPNSGEQYSTAKDVTIMMRKVLSYPEYYNYSKIWMEDYTHPDGRITEIVNTNKLIRFFPQCDGGKTGFTNEAGFCLSATGKMGNTRVVATLLGASDGKARFRKVSEMMKYAFANYETTVYLSKGEIIPANLPIIKGAKEQTFEFVCDADVKFFAKKGENKPNVEISFDENLKAPIAAGQKIGRIELKNDKGEIVSSANILNLNEIEKNGFGDILKKIISMRYFSFGNVSE